jgi:HSP20 family protein
MAEQVPVKREENLPAVREGEHLPAWREPSRLFGDIETVFDRMVRGFFGNSLWASPWQGGFVPAVDIEETDDAYIFEIELPGLRRDDITVETRENELHISGEVIERERTGTMRHRTRRTGHFSYRVSLPPGTDPDSITASYSDGVLTVTIPRGEVSKPHRIDII